MTVTGLWKTFESERGAVSALEDIDLEVRPGEFVSVVGASGCGKTTLLKSVAGLVTPTRGSVTVGSDEIRGPYTDAGVVFQKDLLLEWRTALDNVLLLVEMQGLRKRDYRSRASELLERVGLKGFELYYPSQLSGGMRQRVAICRALLREVPLLLMDEPFGALDALTRDQLNLDLETFLHFRPTVLFVTHSIDEAVFLADRVAVITPRPGRIDTVIEVDLPRPRRLAVKDEAKFGEYTASIRSKFLELGVLHDLEADDPELASAGERGST